MSEQAFARARRLVSRAAFSQSSWEDAIAAVATATNSRTGQLIGLGMPGSLRFNIMTDVDPFALAEFTQVGGSDPMINSRVRVGITSPEMRWFGDADLTPEQDAHRSPAFADWISRNRLGECRLVSLVKEDRALVGAGVVRDVSRPGYSSAELARLSDLGIALRNAITARLAIEGDQAAIVAGSFDQIARPVFVCGPDGRIQACSGHAEQLVRAQRWLTVDRGRLVPANRVFSQELAQLIARFCYGQTAHGETENALILRDQAGAPLLVRVHSFPDTDPFRLTMSALVVPCVVEQREDELSHIALQMFGLTPAEALVLAHIASGRKPEAIATLIGVRPSTVRSHLKRIFLKTGTNSQLEVSALLRHFS